MKLKPMDRRSPLRKTYDDAVTLLNTFVPGTNAYDRQLKNVERLHKLLMDEKANKKGVTGDGVLGFAGSIGAILLIVNAESVAAVTSKALPFVLRGRPR